MGLGLGVRVRGRVRVRIGVRMRVRVRVRVRVRGRSRGRGRGRARRLGAAWSVIRRRCERPPESKLAEARATLFFVSAHRHPNPTPTPTPTPTLGQAAARAAPAGHIGRAVHMVARPAPVEGAARKQHGKLLVVGRPVEQARPG